jgi:hypothetical protein
MRPVLLSLALLAVCLWAPVSARAANEVKWTGGLRLSVVELARTVDLSRGKEEFLTVTVEVTGADPVRLRRVLPVVIERAFAVGLVVRGLDGPCGPPLCAFGADPRITGLTPIPEQLDGRTYLAACADCAVRDACFGVRVADVELYGDACAQPLAARPAA